MRNPSRPLSAVLILWFACAVVGCRAGGRVQSPPHPATPAAAVIDPQSMRIEIENERVYADGWQVIELEALKELARQRGVTAAEITGRPGQYAFLPKALEAQRALQEAGVKRVTIGHGNSHPR